MTDRKILVTDRYKSVTDREKRVTDRKSCDRQMESVTDRKKV